MPAPKMTRDEVSEYLAEIFPEINRDGDHFVIDTVRSGGARVRLNYDDRFLRPGGTISGPAIFTLADYAVYVAIIASAGKVPLAVTINANINFLRRPAATDLIADVTLIKHGRRLVVAEARLISPGMDGLVAHFTATYSMTPGV